MQINQLLKCRDDFFRRQDDVHYAVRVRDRYFEAVPFASTRDDHLSGQPCFRRRNDQRIRDFVVDGGLQCDEIGQRALRPLRGGGGEFTSASPVPA